MLSQTGKDSDSAANSGCVVAYLVYEPTSKMATRATTRTREDMTQKPASFLSRSGYQYVRAFHVQDCIAFMSGEWGQSPATRDGVWYGSGSLAYTL